MDRMRKRERRKEEFGYIKRSLAAVALLAAWMSFTGCRGKTSENSPAIDLMKRFSFIEAGVPKTLERQVEVIRRGQKRKAFILVAPGVARASLQGVSGEMTLKCLVAPVFDVGDGIQMDVFLKRDRNRIRVGSRYFDPGRKAQDRNWISLAMPLCIQRGDQLEIEVSGGPQGDLVADWLAFSSVYLTP
jgi:hypothetical protein